MSTNNMLNRFFTQYVFKDLLSNKDSSIYNSIVDKYICDFNGKNNKTLISEIYGTLAKSYRNEYFYMNTLLNKLLLGKHNINTTTALTQVPINKSKADFVLINGKAVVYEIKTDLDSFDRLATQIADYYKAFNNVCVVTSEKNFNKLVSILENTDVGVYVLTNKNTISSSMSIAPKSNDNSLEHSVLFKILHKKEYESILSSIYGELPKTTPVFYYKECLSLFSKIPINKAYQLMLQQLKCRNHITKEIINTIPYELKALIYFSNKGVLRYNELQRFLNNQFGE